MVTDLKKNGKFLLNCPWNEDQLETHLPAKMKNLLAAKNAELYTIDALAVATAAGSPKSQNMVLQAAFFKIADIIPYDDAEVYMKEKVKVTYGKKGDAVVKANCDAIDAAVAS